MSTAPAKKNENYEKLKALCTASGKMSTIERDITKTAQKGDDALAC